MSSRMTRRQLIGATTGLAVTAVVAACAPPPPPSPTAAPVVKPTEMPTTQPAAKAAPAPGATEVRIHFREGDIGRHFQAYAAKFAEKNPKISVKAEPLVTGSEYWAKLATMYASKTIGDLVVEISMRLRSQAAMGFYRELDSLAKADKFDLGQYYPAAVEICSFEGKLMGLPETFQYQAVLILSNETLFADAGVPVPNRLNATYDEIVEKAVKLTKPADGLFGYGGATTAQAWSIHVRSFGGDVVDKSMTKSRLLEPEALEGTEWIYNMLYERKAHARPDQLTGTSENNLFAAGKMAMLQSALWNATFLIPLVGNRFKYSATLIPKGPTGIMGSRSQSDMVSMTSLTKVPDAAWEVAKFMTSKEIGIEKVYMASGGPGARPDVLEDPGLQEKMIGLKEFVAALKEGRPAMKEPVAANYRDNELGTVISQNLDPIWLNKLPPREGMKKLHEEVQKVLDKPKLA